MVLFLWAGSSSGLPAQQDRDIERWMAMDLEELSQVRLVSVSVGRKNLSLRESPGIVSLITEEEIEQSGARDLVDLLRRVPGFDFAVDVESTVGLGVRGNWAHEGKVMILLDGQELNDMLYAIFPFGSHMPLDQIARIEIIRGPGSSIYGGYAELAVINIVSKIRPGAVQNEFSLRYGQMSSSCGGGSLTLTGGGRLSGLEFALGISAGKGRRSQLDYQDFFGGAYDMEDDSRFGSGMINLGLGYKNFKLRYLFDYYGYRQRDSYGEVMPLPIRYDFLSHHIDIGMDLPLGKTLKLIPGVNYSVQYPWNSTDANSRALDYYYKLRCERLKLSLNLAGDLSDTLFVHAGVSRRLERGRMLGDTRELYLFKGQREIDYSGTTLFVQTFFKTAPATFSAGLRYESHTLFRDSLVPWIGINKDLGRWHFKLLFGQSLRIPSMANISLGQGIRSEKATEFDFEAGFQIDSHMSLSLNLFSNGIRDTIVYGAEPESDEEFYWNSGQTGSWGLELEYRLNGSWGSLSGSYSHYRARNDRLEMYSVPSDSRLLLGFPAHKVCLSSSWRLAEGIRVNPTLIYYSKRYGCSGLDEGEKPWIQAFPSAILASVSISFREIFKNLDLSLGVHDLFDIQYPFLQPYTGLHAPFPGRSREVVLRLGYRIE